MIKHLEFRNEQSDVFIIWVYGEETYSAKEITGIFSSIFSVMYVCVCVCTHTYSLFGFDSSLIFSHGDSNPGNIIEFALKAGK